MAAIYLLLSAVVYYRFYHHPSHLGLKLGKIYQNLNYSFYQDNTSSRLQDSQE